MLPSTQAYQAATATLVQQQQALIAHVTELLSAGK
jgi:hypothetical protein